jgi:hypothetical protein
LTNFRRFSYIDYYGVTFDHLVPADDPYPEVLAISIFEVDNDGGAFANKHLLFPVDPTEYTGKKVLAVPRCCQVKKGTRDRNRINDEVAEMNSYLKKLHRHSTVGTKERHNWGGHNDGEQNCEQQTASTAQTQVR